MHAASTLGLYLSILASMVTDLHRSRAVVWTRHKKSSAFVCCVKQNMDKLLHRAYHDTRSVKSKKPVSPPLYRQHIYLKMCPEFFSYPPKKPPHRECRLILLIGESIPVVSSRGKTGHFYKRSVHFARETSGLKPVTAVECTKIYIGHCSIATQMKWK